MSRRWIWRAFARRIRRGPLLVGVGVGFGAGRYVAVVSSDTRLKALVAGRAAREKPAQTLTSQLGVRVLMTYSTPSQASQPGSAQEGPAGRAFGVSG